MRGRKRNWHELCFNDKLDLTDLFGLEMGKRPADCSLCEAKTWTCCVACTKFLCAAGCYEKDDHVCPCRYMAIYWCWRQLVKLPQDDAYVLANGGL